MWVPIHQSLPRHPKVIRLARELGIKRCQAVGHLCCLWLWCLDYAADGDISKFGPEEIAIGAEWDGDHEKFRAAIESCGFVDAPGMMHDWGSYAGKVEERKRSKREHAKSTRKTPGSSDETRGQHVDATRCPQDASVDATRTTCGQSVEPQVVHVDTQIREDKTRQELTTIGSSPIATTAPSACPQNDIKRATTAKKGDENWGKWSEIGAALRAHDFPELDLRQIIRALRPLLAENSHRLPDKLAEDLTAVALCAQARHREGTCGSIPKVVIDWGRKAISTRTAPWMPPDTDQRKAVRLLAMSAGGGVDTGSNLLPLATLHGVKTEQIA